MDNPFNHQWRDVTLKNGKFQVEYCVAKKQYRYRARTTFVLVNDQRDWTYGDAHPDF